MNKTYWELTDPNAASKSALELECSVAKTVKLIDVLERDGFKARQISAGEYRKLMRRIEEEEGITK
jgi:hypothetical protein